MWKVYKWNGMYIQGDLVSTITIISSQAAMKSAKKNLKHKYAVKDNRPGRSDRL